MRLSQAKTLKPGDRLSVVNQWFGGYTEKGTIVTVSRVETRNDITSYCVIWDTANTGWDPDEVELFERKS